MKSETPGVAFVLAILLAGCVAPSVTTEDAAGDRDAPLAFLCPAPAPKPCFAKLDADGAPSRELRAALHPADALVMAIGASERPTTARPATDAILSSENCIPVVHVSRNGGATWTRSEVPVLPPVAAATPYMQRCFRDVRPTFTGDGGLIVVASETASTPAYWIGGEARWRFGRPEVFEAMDLVGRDDTVSRSFAVASADGGATWTQPYEFELANIHPEVTWSPHDGHVYALVRSPKDGRWAAQIAWSGDAGRTWQEQPHDEAPSCRTPGEPMPRADGIWFACAVYPDDAPAPRERGIVAVFRYDPARRATELRGELAFQGPFDFLWPQVFAPEDGALALVNHAVAVPLDAATRDESYVAWSLDGGATWTEPQVVRSERMPAMRDMETSRALDAAGRIHVLATFREEQAEGDVAFTTYHVAFDADGRRVAERVLEGGVIPASAVPAALAPSRTWLPTVSYTLAFGAESGLLARASPETLAIEAALVEGPP